MVTSTRVISNEINVELLQSSPHFAGLSADELEKIRRVMTDRRVSKDEIIWLDGDPCRTLYFVASGLIKVFITSAEGKEQIIKVIRPGESFGDNAIFDINGNTVSAQAMVPSVLYGIEKSELEALLSEYPRAALNIIKVLVSQIYDYLSLVQDLSFKRVTERLARILLENCEEITDYDPPRLTHREIAAMAGTEREVIARSLKSLEEKGVIRRDNRRIIITNSQVLQEMAG